MKGYGSPLNKKVWTGGLIINTYAVHKYNDVTFPGLFSSISALCGFNRIVSRENCIDRNTEIKGVISLENKSKEPLWAFQGIPEKSIYMS
ncbi:MAG: hypothetical protein P8105_02040 [Dehalococcoidia bacterium]